MLIWTISDALFWTGKVVSLAVFFQTVELLWVRRSFSESGVWSWKTLRPEFVGVPAPFLKILDVLLEEPGFLIFLSLRLLCAVLAFFFPLPIFLIFLLLSSILISARWRGSFNGGSDYMTVIVLLGLSFAAVFPGNTRVAKAALLYIAIQASLSYFVAGLVKIRNREWRSGRALSLYLTESNYDVPSALRSMARSPGAMRIGTWAVLLFECAFPIAWLDPRACLALIATAFLFHLGNVYALGLNRFLWAWAATYPALYYWSGNSLSQYLRWLCPPAIGR